MPDDLIFPVEAVEIFAERYPHLVLDAASKIIADEGELTPAMKDRIRRLSLELKRRRDRAEVVNDHKPRRVPIG